MDSFLKSTMSNSSNIWIYLIFLSIVFTNSVVQSEVEDLCNVNGCSCTTNALRDDLIDVYCQCQNGQSLSIGPSGANDQLALPPETTGQLNISNCQQVEIFSKTFNSMPNIQNIMLSGLETLILHSRLYEDRVGNGQKAQIKNFDIESVQNLIVKRHTFEGVNIEDKFMLNSVIVQRVPSLAFAFDSVNQFSILRSRFDRVSMWGFKLQECNEFNVMGPDTRFFSLASQAFHMKCNKFWLAFNTFDNLQDASLSVTYGLADIQGNTFEKLTGKPFVDLRPMTNIEESVNTQGFGLIFRENKFACDPILPFNAMAMPSFNLLNNPGAKVEVDNNHFVCNCDKTNWFIAAMTHEFDRDVIANGGGSLQFLQYLWDTAGNCVTCSLRQCDVTQERFHDFARNALIIHKNELKCSSSGKALKSQNPDGQGMNFFGAKGEEESLADTRNMELMNGSPISTHGSPYHLVTLLIMALLAMKVIV